MKEKKEELSKENIKRKSLYRYILLAFVITMLVMFLITSLYFRYARYYLIELFSQQGIDFSQIDKERVVDGVIGAVFETLILSAIIGFILVAVVFKHVIGPIRKMSEATKKVAKGDFKTQIETKKNRNDEIGILTDNFHMMVRELESNEYYEFTGWDKDFSSVTDDLDVYATAKKVKGKIDTIEFERVTD